MRYRQLRRKQQSMQRFAPPQRRPAIPQMEAKTVARVVVVNLITRHLAPGHPCMMHRSAFWSWGAPFGLLALLMLRSRLCSRTANAMNGNLGHQNLLPFLSGYLRSVANSA